MPTNLALESALLDRAVEDSGAPTKKAAITLALQEFIALRDQRKLTELFGQLERDQTVDYKSERARE